MKRIFVTFLILILIAPFTIKLTSAQNDVPKTKFLVWEVKVTPSQHSNLLEAVKFQHDFLKEQDYPYTGYVNYTSDGLFYYSTPFMQFSEIDEMNEVDEKLWKDFPEKQKEIWSKFEGNFKSVGSIIMELQPEISKLRPDDSEYTVDKHFRFFEKFTLKNGKLMEMYLMLLL